MPDFSSFEIVSRAVTPPAFSPEYHLAKIED
jgi:hypothetical protein